MCVAYRIMFFLRQLEDWWLDTAYLEVRIPSQLNVNFGGPTAYLEHCWPLCEGTQLERSSINLWFILQYWDLIRTYVITYVNKETADVEINFHKCLISVYFWLWMACFCLHHVSNMDICLYLLILIRERLAVHKAGTIPFDMDQFRMLFCTCKVPGITKDTILNFFKTGQAFACLFVCIHVSIRMLHDAACVISACCRERRTLPFSHDSDVSWEGVHIWCSLWWPYPHPSRAVEVWSQASLSSLIHWVVFLCNLS